VVLDNGPSRSLRQVLRSILPGCPAKSAIPDFARL